MTLYHDSKIPKHIGLKTFKSKIAKRTYKNWLLSNCFSKIIMITMGMTVPYTIVQSTFNHDILRLSLVYKNIYSFHFTWFSLRNFFLLLVFYEIYLFLFYFIFFCFLFFLSFPFLKPLYYCYYHPNTSRLYSYIYS